MTRKMHQNEFCKYLGNLLKSFEISFINIIDGIRGVFGDFVDGQHSNEIYSKGSLDRLQGRMSEGLKIWVAARV